MKKAKEAVMTRYFQNNGNGNELLKKKKRGYFPALMVQRMTLR